MGLTHTDNGDGTVTQYDDSGRELVTFPDPDGSFLRDHVQPAAASEATPAPTSGSNADAIWAKARALAPTTHVLPDNSVIEPEQKTDFASALNPPVMPSQEKTAKVPPGVPSSNLPVAGQETTGLTEADREAHRSQRLGVAEAQEKANTTQTAAEQAALAAREARVQGESDRALGRFASDLQLHELAKKSTLDAEEFVKKARAEAPDPGKALAGPKFFYAIMAGVGASLSNFGAALLGQQGHADTNVVDDIIADSVKQQLEERKFQTEGAQDDLDQKRKDELRLSIQANASLEKWFQAQAAVEQSPEVRATYAAHSDERRAAIEADQAKLAEKEWTTAVQKQAVPKPVKGAGKGPVNAETAQDQAALAANGVDQKAFTKYGTERQKLGADVTLRHIADARQIIKDLTEKGSTDVPGVGPIDKPTQALLRSNDASKVQQALGQVVTTFIKNRSGSAVTDAERNYLEKIITGSGSNQMEGIDNGLRHVEAEVGQQLDVLNTANSGAARAYDQINRNRSGRVKLTDEQKKNRAHQLEPKTEAAPAAAASSAPAAADPVRRIREKGFNRALNDFLGDDGSEAPGSAM